MMMIRTKDDYIMMKIIITLTIIVMIRLICVSTNKRHKYVKEKEFPVYSLAGNSVCLVYFYTSESSYSTGTLSTHQDDMLLYELLNLNKIKIRTK